MTPANSAGRGPEEDLARTLARQADRFAARGGSLDLEQVLDRAGEIRRGRRMRATMVMAAVVVAVAVPVGITVLNNPTDPAQPPVATRTTDPDTSRVSLGADLESGAAPKTGYLVGNTLHTGEGKTVTLPGGTTITDLVHLDEGYLVAEIDAKNDATVRYLGEDGTPGEQTWSYAGTGIAVSPERSVGAFVQLDGTVTAVEAGDARFFDVGTTAADQFYGASAITGENCSGRSEETGCTIYLSGGGEKQQALALSPNQEPKPVYPGFKDIKDVSDRAGLAIGLTTYGDAGSCSEARTETGAVAWKTCDFTPLAFSPDGKYVLAGSAYLDGAGDGRITILDAQDGKPVLDLRTVDNSFLNQPIWEDDTHVLAAVAGGGKWAIVRFEVNGHREATTATATSEDPYVSPFRLPNG